MSATQYVILPTFGSGGIDELCKHIDDAAPSWALLRIQTGSGASTRERIVTVAIQGVNTSAAESEKLDSLTSHIFEMLGDADVKLQVQRGQDLTEKLLVASDFEKVEGGCCEEPSRVHYATKAVESKESADSALTSVCADLSSHNWALLEPTDLALYRAGCGGLDELKEWLPADKVLFGILRFSFPREDCAPPIVKHMFIHWIGQNVSVIRRGQWNSKLENAVSVIRKTCDFAFRKTAYVLGDLALEDLVAELARVTCAASSDTRQLSAAWYLEGLQTSRQDCLESGNFSRVDSGHTCETLARERIFLPESAKRAISKVRDGDCHWRWIHLKVAEGKVPSSGGA